ncbi:hypothetical protein [Breoghania sp. JC706]|uniref:hypothetical protein n=1 Tax=Breoghania sp. JC706 TaxID=3117732 RepID=UPI00300B1453
MLAMAAGMVDAAWDLYGDMRDNRTIRALHAGHDVAPRAGADPRAILARALFLTWRDHVMEAEALEGSLANTDKRLRSAYHFAIGNARMRAAYELIDVGKPSDAIPEVALAKRAYRAALHADPGDFDAKVNLDIAMRLVRDMPREGEANEEEQDTRPRRVWTDLPGLPRGAP